MDVTEDADSRALRETVAAIGARFGHGYFAENARSGDFPEALWAHLVDGGFAGANIDPAYGGGGGRLSDLAAVAEELAKAGCPLMSLVVSPALCGPILQEFGTAEQKDRWLTGIGSGLERMAFAVTEADAGANTRNIRTRAERVSEGWVLHGEKQFISGIESSPGSHGDRADRYRPEVHGRTLNFRGGVEYPGPVREPDPDAGVRD